MSRIIESSVTVTRQSNRTVSFYSDCKFDYDKIEELVDTIYDYLINLIPNDLGSDWKDFNTSLLSELNTLQNELNNSFTIEVPENKRYSVVDPRSGYRVDIDIHIHNISAGYISEKEKIAHNTFGIDVGNGDPSVVVTTF